MLHQIKTVCQSIATFAWTKSKRTRTTAVVLSFACAAAFPAAPASGQVTNAAFEADYAASGFVAPAGMMSPEEYYSRVEQASFFGPGGPIAGRMANCDSSCGPMGCDGCGSDCGGSCGYGGGCGYGDSCGNGYGSGCGGCGADGCPSCGGLTNWRYLCLFCQGGGCEVCQSIGRGYLLGALQALMPYRDAGLCAQRWFDVSAEVMFLNHTRNTDGTVLTTQGIAGAPVLFANSADDDTLRAGARLTAAFICGAGGNIEGSYMGGNEWGDSATATSVAPTLYSFISNFGAPPAGGFDDTDRSFSQTVNTFSTLHSAEINYRRRTVGQYCRFQGSWLVGLRYLRFDSDFGFSTVGVTVPPNPRFFNYRNEIDNKLFGPQAGFDVWWNVIPGINLGFAAKGAWMDNNVDRHTVLQGNSLGPLAIAGTRTNDDGRNKSTLMGEFELTSLYRISHSWTIKSQYYVMAIDDIAQGYDLSAARGLGETPPNTNSDPIGFDRLTIQGFSLGAEYLW